MSIAELARWLYLALLIAPGALLLRRGGRAWIVLGIGQLCGAAGWLLLLALGTDAIAGPASVLWLAMYACVLVSLTELARPWLRRLPARAALDGATVMLAAAALVAALLLQRLGDNPGGLTFGERIVVSLYPAAGCLLLTVALIGAAVAGRRGGPAWTMLAAGIVMLVTGDVLSVRQAAAGTWQPLMASNALHPLWALVAAAAAYVPVRERRVIPRAVSSHAAALLAALAAIGLLVAAHWTGLPAPTIVLAALALVLAVHRSGLALLGDLRAQRVTTRERERVDAVRLALAADALELHFQPLVDARSGAVHGAEALLRWRRGGELIAPDRFLPAIERSELIAPLTDWVLDRALAQAAAWGGLGVSVNLATANLAEPDLPARVLAALRRHGVLPAALTLEITETAAIRDSAITDCVLGALDEAGVGLSVDDFGTGHSSLLRLARFPICELKVDRSFVREMHGARRPIVAPAIELGHALGVRVVAEGVEDARTLRALRELGCDLAQGYHISRPLPAAEFSAWLAAHDRGTEPLGLVDLDRAAEPTRVHASGHAL